jgi:YfiH family protein
MHNFYIKPIWPAPQNIHAFTTTKAAGNLLDLECHGRVREQLNLPSEPVWLEQVHGNKVIRADEVTSKPKADASYTAKPNVICAVLTADCLPILLCDSLGTKVAAIHAGWRSLAGGIIEKTIKELNIQGSECMVWFGPAIGPEKFEVGLEVYEKFLQHDEQAKSAFKKTNKNKWLANIYLLAKQRLLSCGVENIYGGDFCTFTNREKFFSYRRDGETGRMSSLIWLNLI